MNQAIHFPERECWDWQQQAVIFPALVNGMGITCAISQSALHARFGEGEAMALFCAHRWDIEEEAEKLILTDAISDQGWVWLS
ncbi:DUF1488 domain-containing protein [Pantoea sp. M_9]|uniref:DUF1488 domain-containing protein n=1 Tax=Pantoea sp. M_9 TaxID=2608041 RepID=UPI0012328F79|nr:DUF1488 domain-containing protein [Pantoea sp. M_9]KAA5962970.1 DUF1488 domain-containing protein [Pantoea sp. M_9]